MHFIKIRLRVIGNLLSDIFRVLPIFLSLEDSHLKTLINLKLHFL